MTEWCDMSELEKDLARIAAVLATGIALAGAAAGWALRFFTERHQFPGRSEHFK